MGAGAQTRVAAAGAICPRKKFWLCRPLTRSFCVSPRSGLRRIDCPDCSAFVAAAQVAISAHFETFSQQCRDVALPLGERHPAFIDLKDFKPVVAFDFVLRRRLL
jgi:hypothetical protein